MNTRGCRAVPGTRIENDIMVKEGLFNQGAVTLNIPQIAIRANKDENEFWKLLDEGLELVREALMIKHNSLKGVLSDSSPIHFQHGGISRLNKGETIDKLLYNGYSTISIGYIGLHEAVQAMLGVSNTTTEGEQFAMRIMNYLRSTADKWKAETNIGFSLYSTPAETVAGKLCAKDVKQFGVIKNVTDRGYYTNSFHVHVSEEIDAFTKLSFESNFAPIASAGNISYVEAPYMEHNLEALYEVVKHIYNTSIYAEINIKSDNCHVCGFEGECLLEDNKFICPQCGNDDEQRLNVVRRVCGYLSANYFNKPKVAELAERKLHL